MKRMAHHLDQYIEHDLGGAALVTFTSLVIYQVVMRYVFSNSPAWSGELARFSLIWFVYLSGSYAVRYQRHVKFDLLPKALDRLAPTAGAFLRITVLLLWLCLLILFMYLSINIVINLYSSGQTSPAAGLPMWVIYIGVPLGVTLMAFRLSQHIYALCQTLYEKLQTPSSAKN